MYKNKKLGAGLAFITPIIFLMCFAIKVSIAATPANNRDAEYSHDIALINNFRQVSDLPKFKVSADLLLAKWLLIDKQKYATLTCDICIVLSSTNFHDKQQSSLSEQYALTSLNTVHPISVQTQACIVMYGMSQIPVAKNSIDDQIGTSMKRSIYAEKWFKTWQRINTLINPNFDPRKFRVEANVLPPANPKQLMFPGMSPSSIQDLKVRHEYERLIAMNNEKIEYMNEQIALRQLYRTFSHSASDFLTSSYSVAPYNLDELKKYITQYPANAVVESDVLNRVEANIKLSSQKR